MKTINVTVAGRDYIITPLPIRKNREWRKQFDKPINDAASLITEIGSYANTEFEDGKAMVEQIGKAVSGGSLSPVVRHLLGSADTIINAVFDYSPAMQEDRKHIEENGFDDEIVSAFLSILSLAFPFGQAIKGLMALGKEEEKEENGQKEQQTEVNSASQSSESTTKT